jgi:hypothetical protein
MAVTTAYRTVAKELQEQLVQQVKDRWALDKGSLLAPLNQDVLIAAGLAPTLRNAYPASIHVFPPMGQALPEVTKGVDGTLGLECYVRVRVPDDVDGTTILREAVGLVVDGYQDDPLLAGKCAGPAAPVFQWDSVALEGSEAVQVVVVNVIRRWE